MREVRQAVLRSRGRAAAPQKSIPTRARCTHRDASTPSLGLLAPAFGQALPSLTGVPATYSYSENAGTLIDFCRVLVENDLADEALWTSSGKQPLRFAATTVRTAIERHCGELLKRNVNYEFSIGDSLGDFRDQELREGVLVLSVDCSGCGYLKIGPALAAMEKEAEGLGAAFYHLLRFSLYRWMRVYDHTDAQAYEENLREWAELLSGEHKLHAGKVGGKQERWTLRISPRSWASPHVSRLRPSHMDKVETTDAGG